MSRKAKRTFRTFDPDTDDFGFHFDYNLEETETLRHTLGRKENVSIHDLRRIALWKIDRVLCVDNDTLAKLDEISKDESLRHDSDLAKDVLQKLVSSQGVGFPMASAILKFLRPEVFPIIDVRAYRAWRGTVPNRTTYSIETYIEYVNWIKSIAHRKGLRLDQVDEQLYCWDRDTNGTIAAKGERAE